MTLKSLKILFGFASIGLGLSTLIFHQESINYFLHPGYGACFRCKRTWDVVESHVTVYGPPPNFETGAWGDAGCFPLCEKCWTELRTPEARLPYYRRLIESWKRWDDFSRQAEDRWPAIKTAVLGGK